MRSNEKQCDFLQEDGLFGSDDTFAFIAGYTAGGFPYGVTWEEMEEIERGENDDVKKGKLVQCDEGIDLPFY